MIDQVHVYTCACNPLDKAPPPAYLIKIMPTLTNQVFNGQSIFDHILLLKIG